jgi:hypothetical protein
MDALNFEYPDYERLNKGAEGQKRKRIVSVLSRRWLLLMRTSLLVRLHQQHLHIKRHFLH